MILHLTIQKRSQATPAEVTKRVPLEGTDGGDVFNAAFE